MQYDLIAVGDTVTDAFIKLKEAHINCKVNSEECELCMRFADKVPYESVTEVLAVGNSANAAVSGSRLGLKVALMTNIGGDRVGEECIKQLARENISADLITVHPKMKTNYHYVLQYGAERTILIKHEAYPYRIPTFLPPKWIYLSSLAENTNEYQLELAKIIAERGVKLAFQPGTFQMKAGVQALAPIYRATELFICNKEEANRILGSDETDVKKLIADIHALGPRIVTITDARAGAHASDGTNIYFVPMYPDPAEPVNRTGAGDAFASTLTTYLALGKTLPEALIRAPINSAFVTQKVGAQAGLLTKDELEGWLAKAPANYKVEKVA